MSKSVLAKRALSEGVLGKSSEARVKQIVTIAFSKRLLEPSEMFAATQKELQVARAPLRLQRELLLLFTLRSSPMLQEFMKSVFWPKKSAGFDRIGRDQVVDFFARLEGTKWIEGAWTPTTRLKVSRSVLQTLAEFGLLEDHAALERKIFPFRITSEVVAYLAHENRSFGRPENALFDLPDWAWYGIPRDRVFGELMQASEVGQYVAQFSGDLLRISFSYPTMEDYLNAVARG